MFDWDAANLGHIAEHDVTPTEAEEVIFNKPLDLTRQARNGEARLLQLGETNAGRVLVIVTTPRNNRIRFVTAFPANRQYRQFYAAQKARGVHGEENAS